MAESMGSQHMQAAHVGKVNKLGSLPLQVQQANAQDCLAALIAALQRGPGAVTHISLRAAAASAALSTASASSAADTPAQGARPAVAGGTSLSS